MGIKCVKWSSASRMSLPAAPGSEMLRRAARGVGEMGDDCLDPSDVVWDSF